VSFASSGYTVVIVVSLRFTAMRDTSWYPKKTFRVSLDNGQNAVSVPRGTLLGRGFRTTYGEVSAPLRKGVEKSMIWRKLS